MPELARGELAKCADRPREMLMSEFVSICRRVRAARPPLIGLPAALLALSDGLPWEAATAGMDLAEGKYARVAGSVLDPDKSGDFLVLLSRQHSDTHWLVDVGDGDEIAVEDFSAVRIRASGTRSTRLSSWEQNLGLRSALETWQLG